MSGKNGIVIPAASTRRVGVSVMALYVPRPRVSLEAWCQWTGNPWEKIKEVVGRSFRQPARYENVYTMAANAVLRLIEKNDVDPGSVGFLALGTESSKDNSAGAVIVRGMVDRALEQRGLPRLSRACEVPEFKHACLGGVYALKGALRYVAGDGAGRRAIVVCGDVAEYERGSTGEQTQGAGSVALLVEENAQLFEADLRHAGSASAYRGPDFRKPFARHFMGRTTEGTARLHDFPVFSGKYSTFAYIDETLRAVEDMLQKLGKGGREFYRDVRAMFFHRPYHAMPLHAMSFLQVLSLAYGDGEALARLCKAAGVDVDTVLAEARSTPDLYGSLLEHSQPIEPYPAMSAAATTLRKSPEFDALTVAKMNLGADLAMDLGNLYTAALPAWLAAGFTDALEQKLDLAGSLLLAVGYGSGDAAEAIPLRVAERWQEATARIGFREALASPINLEQAQYEALHDGRDVPDLTFDPRGEFVISRVGEIHEAAFQDLGVEYYEYVA